MTINQLALSLLAYSQRSKRPMREVISTETVSAMRRCLRGNLRLDWFWTPFHLHRLGVKPWAEMWPKGTGK